MEAACDGGCGPALGAAPHDAAPLVAPWAQLPDAVLVVGISGGTYFPDGVLPARTRAGSTDPLDTRPLRCVSGTPTPRLPLPRQLIGSSFGDMRQLDGASRACKGWRSGFASGITAIELSVHRDARVWWGPRAWGRRRGAGARSCRCREHPRHTPRLHYTTRARASPVRVKVSSLNPP